MPRAGGAYGVLGQNHPHTWEISLDTVKVTDDFVQFDFIEREVEKYFSYFQDVNINSIDPFTAVNPTLENLCEHFKNDLSDLLTRSGWLLQRIEMSETPGRTYVISMLDEQEMEQNQTVQTLTDLILDEIKHIGE